ncbi:MAG: UDP-N-acetylmuramoyl-L-alanyl-D-glutamate--2,6-diaminopimelate ligase [Microbacteriaceae bacterium]|nr:UDP-N-acetylmuramoyl-L-alanyl-D-glutamate--2,6-diaminopimelate ligase [Microbacteriaceae bacterium]MCL2796127.1 UDP-N-acetylmuramoyl-L-alanyl-D-glutamate--2,6-diaminopimelate ligase [Microbacteriaceae bacterium]
MSLTQPAPPVRPRRRPAKALAELIELFGDERSIGSSNPDAVVSGITLNSATVEPGDVFVALTGRLRHGATFAADAQAAGAVAILTDGAGVELAAATGLPVVVHDELRADLGAIAAWLFDTAASPIRFFGVTGTDGKTSMAHILEAILSQMGVPTGLSSTAERHVDGQRLTSGLTTPETVDLHSLIARWTEGGVEAAVIEVSAQAIERHRVDGVLFDVAGFTNLTHDHLDDYGDMATYFEAKRPFLTSAHARAGVVSLDTAWGRTIAETADIPVQTLSGEGDTSSDWVVEVTAETIDGVAFTLTRAADGWSLASSVSVLGRHMATNAALAIAMLSVGGYADERIEDAVRGGIRVYVPGRAELISGDRGPMFWVDYGHSENSMVKNLDAVRAVMRPGGRLICIFGAAGNRDALKRPFMAASNVDHSDLVIITDHHPNMEDPAAIRKTLREAAQQRADETKPGFPVLEIAAPEEAMRHAIAIATEDDTILYFGPGHEHFRNIKGERVPYGGVDEVRAALREAGWPPR